MFSLPPASLAAASVASAPVPLGGSAEPRKRLTREVQGAPEVGLHAIDPGIRSAVRTTTFAPAGLSVTMGTAPPTSMVLGASVAAASNARNTICFDAPSYHAIAPALSPAPPIAMSS